MKIVSTISLLHLQKEVFGPYDIIMINKCADSKISIFVACQEIQPSNENKNPLARGKKDRKYVHNVIESDH